MCKFTPVNKWPPEMLTSGDHFIVTNYLNLFFIQFNPLCP